jgi:hypothetical protein
MKYVLLRAPDGTEFPVLFAGMPSHADVAALFAQDRHVPVSAGFVRFFGGPSGACETHDRSVSLHLSPRPGDAMFIAAYYRATLGSIGVRLAEPGRWHISEGEDRPAPVETVPASACVYCPDHTGVHVAPGSQCPDCPARQG